MLSSFSEICQRKNAICVETKLMKKRIVTLTFVMNATTQQDNHRLAGL